MTTYDTPLPIAARATDPQTSVAAALSVAFKQSHLERLHWVFVRAESMHPGMGLTRDEAAHVAKLAADSNTSRRLTDLSKLGFIEKTGATRRALHSTRFQTVWRLTSEGWTEARKT